MANTLKFGNGEWYGKKDTILAYNSENNNFKPLPFDFSRASSATVVNKAGLIETVGSGEPRIDYKDDSKGALKLEPSRTNLLTYSEDFGQSEWNKQAIGTASLPVVTSNYGVSPDGTQNADRLQLNLNGGTTGADLSYMTDYLTATGTTTTSSVYIKSLNSITNIGIRTGSVIKSIDVGTEWQRFDVSDLTSSNRFQFLLYGHLNSQSADLLIYGAQTEAGSYATSYIPTSGSIKTRVADVCNNGGNEQVFNDSEGVLYTEMSALSNDATNRRITISDNTLDNRVVLGFADTSNVILALVGSSGTQFVATPTISNVTSNNKIALKYKQNDFALWINGVEVATDTSGNTPVGLSTLNIHGSTGFGIFHGNLKYVRVYNTALTDSELQALTTI